MEQEKEYNPFSDKDYLSIWGVNTEEKMHFITMRVIIVENFGWIQTKQILIMIFGQTLC
mgnify:CR=1 FL=1